MRRINEIIEQYNESDITERKKIYLIEWFQKFPGQRFDITEVHQEVGEDLDVGRGRVGQILNELEEDSVLESHGEQRKAYELSEDILIPVRYQAIAGLRHLAAVIDVERWGVIGVFVSTTIVWVFMTLPFWILSVLLLVLPQDSFGPLTESEVVLVTLLMTAWLLILVIFTSSLQMIRRWWYDRKLFD